MSTYKLTNGTEPGTGDVLLKVPTEKPPTYDDVKEDQHRLPWARKAEYMLSVIGYCVGLGNIWRFPYICMRNGGGAFLIPFLVSLLICALPVFFLEVALGQFNGKSALQVWSICPMFKGIGISMNILTLFISWYYSMILAWSLIYMVNSCQSTLPWTLCDQPWNTPNCVTPFNMSLTSDTNMTGQDPNLSFANGSLDAYETENASMGKVAALTNGTSSAEEFWMHNVLEITTGLDDLGGLPWHTAIALLVADVVVFIGILKGIRTSGKVVYVTATLPYLLIGIILINGLTLPGAGEGVLYYIKPNFSKLMVAQTWVEAAIQVFYSLGPAWGGLITNASYNKFNNNCLRDSIMLTIICEGTSIFGGFAIFTVLGHMAHMRGVHVDHYAKSGPGLAFIVYPEAVSYLPLPQFWGLLFFIMLFTLGLDSAFVNVETMLTTIGDLWPSFVRKWRVLVSSVAMILLYLAGLVFASRGGMYMFQLADWYVAAFSVTIQAALECVIIGWIYGAERFCKDIEMMIGRRPPYFFVISWKFICPALLMILFGFTLAFYKNPVYAGYVFPTEAIVIGWIYAIVPFMVVIGVAVKEVLTSQGTLLERLRSCCQPLPEWGPADSKLRADYSHEAVQIEREMKL